jgi:hypothetical protein
MSRDIKVRWVWLKIMYIYTIVVAGGFGLGVIVIPDVMRSVFGWPSGDPIVFGVTGSVYLSFALLSILGLRSPLKFVPVLLLQLSYKVVWFIGVILPLLVAGKFPMYAILHVVNLRAIMSHQFTPNMHHGFTPNMYRQFTPNMC